MNRFFENKFISLIGVLAIVLGPFYDAMDNYYFTWIIAVTLIILVFIAIITEYIRGKKFDKSVVHIPVVIKVDDGVQVQYTMNELLKNIEKYYGYKDYKEILKKYYSLNIERLIYEESCDMHDFERLMNFARIIKYNISQLEIILNKPLKIHIAFYRRPAVAFLIGTMFRTNSLSIYQIDNKNEFKKIADISNRKYKERIDEFKKYEITENINDNLHDEVLVVINSASHNVNTNSDDLKIYKNIVKIDLKEPGTIPYENDWLDYAQEIYNVFNKLQINFKSIVVAHSMPESLAIILGIGFGEYWNITITQYNKGLYPKVYKMNEIKYYF